MPIKFTVGCDVYSNVSINYENLDLASIKLFESYPDGLMKFATACCILFMMIGIPGNIITIAALARYKKVRNATALFIINLSLSDLLFCCLNLPLAASTFWNRSWTHGHLLCRIFPFASLTFIAVSLFTILAISVNRYIMIAHPRLYTKIYKPRNIGLIIASIWIVSMGIFIPTVLNIYGRFGLDPEIGLCSILCDKKRRSPKIIYALIAFLLPVSAIILCYTRMFFIVRKSTKKSLQTKKLPPKDKESSSISTTTCNAMRAPTTNTVSSICSNDDTQRIVISNPEIKIKSKNESKNCIKSLQRRKTAFKRSVAFLNMSLPTRKDRRLRTMIIAIMTSFCVCHLPITITQVFVDASTNATTCIVSYILMFSSCSIIDPIIYVLISHEYRKAYKHLFIQCKRTLRITGT